MAETELLKLDKQKLYNIHSHLCEMLIDNGYQLKHELYGLNFQDFCNHLEIIKAQKIEAIKTHWETKKKRGGGGNTSSKAKKGKKAAQDSDNSEDDDIDEADADMVSDLDDGSDDSDDDDDKNYTTSTVTTTTLNNKSTNKDKNVNKNSGRELGKEQGKERKQALDSKNQSTCLTSYVLPVFEPTLEVFEMGLGFFAFKPDGSIALVCWSILPSIGKPILKDLIKFIDNNNYEALTDLILISQSGLTPSAEKSVWQKLSTKYNCRSLIYSFLEINLTKHKSYYKPHIRLTPQQIKEFMANYQILDSEELLNMPGILINDPICIYHDFKLGDIILTSNTGKADNYRMVKPALIKIAKK